MSTAAFDSHNEGGSNTGVKWVEIGEASNYFAKYRMVLQGVEMSCSKCLLH